MTVIINFSYCEFHRLLLKIFTQNRLKRRLKFEVLLFQKHLIMKEIQQRFYNALGFSFYPKLMFMKWCLHLYYFYQAIEGFCRRYSVPLDLVYRKVDGEYSEAERLVEWVYFTVNIPLYKLSPVIGTWCCRKNRICLCTCKGVFKICFGGFCSLFLCLAFLCVLCGLLKQVLQMWVSVS